MAAGALVALLAVLLSACFGASGSATPRVTATPAASQAASAQPSPSASVAASAAPLAPGSYARVSVDGLRIRVSPKASATAVGALFFSDVVRIRSDAGVAGGFHWFEIETVQTANDEHLTGFLAGAKGEQSYLEPMSGPPSPTPPRSPSASPLPSAGESPSP